MNYIITYGLFQNSVMYGQVLGAEEGSSQEIKEWQQKCKEFGSRLTSRMFAEDSNTFSAIQISGVSPPLRSLIKDRHCSAFIFCGH